MGWVQLVSFVFYWLSRLNFFDRLLSQWTQFMALLGEANWLEYKITMMDDFENLLVEYILADSIEHAAWQAQSLSSRRNLLLKDVRITDEW